MGKNSFDKIINSDIPVLIDFHAEWCGPCKAMSPIIQKLAKKRSGQVRIIKIDIDKNARVAQSLNIKGVPTFILYRNGQQLWRQSGMLTETQLDKILEKFISSKNR